MSIEVAGMTLNQEEYGQVITDGSTLPTEYITQGDIVKSVDIQSAQKRFTLDLRDYGPYTFDFTPNGRHLALAGKKGHVATIDWQPKRLHAEFNVGERVRDICYLHNDQMYAVAQNKAVYIYDNTGIQLHALDKIQGPTKLNFLQQHFLLVSGTFSSKLVYLDISIGKIVRELSCGKGSIDHMVSSKQNGIQHISTNRGSVGLWCPSAPSKKPLVEMLCHKCPITSLAIDDSGQYLAAAGVNRHLKIFDLRTYKCLEDKLLPGAASALAYSNTGVLAASYGKQLLTFKKDSPDVYLKHYADGFITSLKYCPFEDVLGVGHSLGYESVLIPGSGEANIDSYEANPYQSKNWRKEKEVKQLLDKIPWQLISLNTDQLAIPRQAIQKVDEESELTRFAKVNRLSGQSAVEEFRRMKLKQARDTKIMENKERKKGVLKGKPYDPLDRFRNPEERMQRAMKAKKDESSKDGPSKDGSCQSTPAPSGNVDNSTADVVKEMRTLSNNVGDEMKSRSSKKVPKEFQKNRKNNSDKVPGGVGERRKKSTRKVPVSVIEGVSKTGAEDGQAVTSNESTSNDSGYNPMAIFTKNLK